MYSTKFVIVLCFVGIVKANNELREIDSISQEYPCTSHGGQCTIAADCPNGQLTEKKGLCPLQRSRGIECCYGISVKETRCRRKGGECFPQRTYCRNGLLFRAATDCSSDEKCCILVK